MRKPGPVARRAVLCGLAGLVLLLPACAQDGHFTLFGYTTQPNYNSEIHTVRVPIFKNQTFRQGLEFDLTREVVKQIEQKTPYKVVSCYEDADTELLGVIIAGNKLILNRNQLNEVREAETILAVELVWRNLRTGEILSQPRREGEVSLLTPIIPGLPAPTAQPDAVELPVPAPTPAPGVAPPPPGPGGPPVPPPPPPVIITTQATFIP